MRGLVFGSGSEDFEGYFHPRVEAGELLRAVVVPRVEADAVDARNKFGAFGKQLTAAAIRVCFLVGLRDNEPLVLRQQGKRTPAAGRPIAVSRMCVEIPIN
jgi:hypothetical protein